MKKVVLGFIFVFFTANIGIAAYDDSGYINIHLQPIPYYYEDDAACLTSPDGAGILCGQYTGRQYNNVSLYAYTGLTKSFRDAFNIYDPKRMCNVDILPMKGWCDITKPSEFKLPSLSFSFATQYDKFKAFIPPGTYIVGGLVYIPRDPAMFSVGHFGSPPATVMLTTEQYNAIQASAPNLRSMWGSMEGFSSNAGGHISIVGSSGEDLSFLPSLDSWLASHPGKTIKDFNKERWLYIKLITVYSMGPVTIDAINFTISVKLNDSNKEFKQWFDMMDATPGAWDDFGIGIAIPANCATEQEQCASGCPNASNYVVCPKNDPCYNCSSTCKDYVKCPKNDPCNQNPCSSGCPNATNYTLCPGNYICNQNSCASSCPNASNYALCPQNNPCQNLCNTGCQNATNYTLCPDNNPCKEPCNMGCPNSTNYTLCPQNDPCQTICKGPFAGLDSRCSKCSGGVTPTLVVTYVPSKPFIVKDVNKMVSDGIPVEYSTADKVKAEPTLTAPAGVPPITDSLKLYAGYVGTDSVIMLATSPGIFVPYNNKEIPSFKTGTLTNGTSYTFKDVFTELPVGTTFMFGVTPTSVPATNNLIPFGQFFWGEWFKLQKKTNTACGIIGGIGCP